MHGILTSNYAGVDRSYALTGNAESLARINEAIDAA